MKPFFFVYKSLTVTWFMFFMIIAVTTSSIIVNALAKKHKEDKNKIDDIFIITLIAGFLGARLSYALMNVDLYKDNIFSLFRISHYNLSLIGGVIFAILALKILSMKYKISFYKLVRIFVIPFYYSMGIMAWLNMFDRLIFSFNYIKSIHLEILSLTVLFLVGMIFEIILPKRINNKYTSIIILSGVIAVYFLM